MVEFQNPDTFRVQPMAQLGESWMYGTDENGDDLTTTVVQMMDTVILGEPDSVKVISLDNGSELFLTKYHGIAGVVSDNDTMALTSIPARNLGGSLLTTADVFDFEVGDVLVYYDHYYYRAQEPFQELIQQGTRSLSRFEVLEVITSGDTLKYHFEVTKIYGSFDWDSGFSGFPYGYATDSIWIEFELSGANRLIERPKGALTSMGMERSHHQPFGFWLDAPNFFDSGEYTYWEEYLDYAGIEHHLVLGKIRNGYTGDRKFYGLGFEPYDFGFTNQNTSLNEILFMNPEDFFSIVVYDRCNEYNMPLLPQEMVGVKTSEDPFDFSVIDIYTYFADFYAFAEGLGGLGYHGRFLGLGSYVEYSCALIGYKKGEEIVGIMAEPGEIQSLSVGNASQNQSYNFYPNPAIDELRYNLPSPVTSATIYDLSGKVVLQKSGSKLNGMIDISDLPAGLYVAKLITDQDIVVGKFVKRE